ncbi:MAG: tetratricopeptide repeat protein, partial [Bacteroidota bacterium]
MAENKETNNLDLDKTLVDTTHKVEDFYANNKKQINMAIIAVVVIIGGYVGYKKLIVEPMDIEAQKEIFMAQNYFEMDSFALALNGNEKFKGFEAIAEEYGASKAGNLAHYYAGICNLRTGQYESAIEHLEDFSTENLLIGPLAEGAIGDAYVELGDLDKGVNHYMKAARMTKNKLTSPVFLKKAGMVYEEKQSYVDALEAYQTIKKDFAESQEAQD